MSETTTTTATSTALDSSSNVDYQPQQQQQQQHYQEGHNIVNRQPYSKNERDQRMSSERTSNYFQLTSKKPLYPSYADQPDIVRASQKDEYYKRIFEEQCFEVLTRLKGARFMMSKQSESKLLANSCFYFLTTLLGSQTLGEEYCNLRQIKDNSFSIPNIFDLYPKLERLHLALFYFNGSYFDFSKRLANIRYIFNRKVDQKRPKYHILGNNKSNGSLSFEEISSPKGERYESNEEESQRKCVCTLCLETRTHTTSTFLNAHYVEDQYHYNL
eukprot:gene680-841_t